MSQPILSICVTTYNRWERLAATLKSITSQNSNEIEVILVDDCSKDKIPSNIEELIIENSIVYIRHIQNRGLPAARNTAIEAAKGKYFSFCDDDDRWDCTAVEKITNALRHEKPNILISQPLYLKGKNKKKETLTLKSIFLRGITPPVGSQVYLLDLIRSVGGYREQIKSGVDHDLWVNLLKKDVQNVLIVNFKIAFLSLNYDETRLTLNIKKRTEGIASSLKKWKPEIETALGINFYTHFGKDYSKHILRKFVIYELKRKKLLSILRLSQRDFFYPVILDLILEKMKIRKKTTSFRPFV